MPLRLPLQLPSVSFSRSRVPSRPLRARAVVTPARHSPPGAMTRAWPQPPPLRARALPAPPWLPRLLAPPRPPRSQQRPRSLRRPLLLHEPLPRPTRPRPASAHRPHQPASFPSLLTAQPPLTREEAAPTQALRCVRPQRVRSPRHAPLRRVPSRRHDASLPLRRPLRRATMQ